MIAILMPDHDLVEMSIFGGRGDVAGWSEGRGQLETKRAIVYFSCFGHMIVFYGKMVMFFGVECLGVTSIQSFEFRANILDKFMG